MVMIYSKDKHTYHGPGIYVGRAMPHMNLAGSVLGNKCKGKTRQQRIANYRIWLWQQIKLGNEVYAELQRIAALAKQGDINLICWCTPNPCHIDVIIRAVEWLNSTGEKLIPDLHLDKEDPVECRTHGYDDCPVCTGSGLLD
jgi:hypothetical protein